MYSAIYLPARKDYDPSEDGFKTKEDAKKFIYRHMCKDCRNDVARYLRSNRKGITLDSLLADKTKTEEEMEQAYFDYGDNWPACACEWLIIETSKLENCNDLGDMFDAAGFERVAKDSEKEKDNG